MKIDSDYKELTLASPSKSSSVYIQNSNNVTLDKLNLKATSDTKPAGLLYDVYFLNSPDSNLTNGLIDLSLM